ncbi:MAG TPA: TonB-dependent receptor [Sphingobium sp.]
MAGPLWAQSDGVAAQAPQESSGEDASSAQSGIQDIVVTANRRAENIQKSSLAIQAFDSESLKRVGVSSATDINKLAPSLQLGYAGSTTQIYVRGVGDASANPLANPGVSFNVDGVYVGRPEGVGVNFFDIERMEVLKGPQGTLYGRNSSGGAINLIAASPKFDGVSGYASAEVGNYGLVHVEGGLNLPLNDIVAVRAAVNRIKRDGYLSDDTSDDNQLAGRLKVLVQPSDTIKLMLSLDGARVRGNGGGTVILPRRPGSSAWEGSSDPTSVAYQKTFNPNLIAGPSALTGNALPFVRNDFWNISAQLDADLGFATLTILPAYRHSNTDTLSYRAQFQRLLGKSDQKTLEIRLGNSSEAVKWVLGGYYFHEHNPGEIRVFVGPGLLQSNPQYDPSGTAWAGFGEATVSVTDQLRVIAGGRYTTERRKLDGNFFLSPATNGNYILVEKFFGDKTFNAFTWRAGAEYDVTEQSMLSLTASKGFKSGGITQTVPPGNIYNPERVLAFELLSRNRFLDNRLQINIEAFHWTYTDQQNARLTFDTLGNVNFLTQNAGKAKLYGINVDIVAKPTTNDTFHAMVEYNKSKYSSFLYSVPFFAYNPLSNGCSNVGTGPGPFVPITTLDCSGFALPHAPRWSLQGDYTHAFDLSNGGKVEATVSGRYAGASWMTVDFVPTVRAPDFAKINASLTYTSPNGAYSLTAYVRNINNGKEYVSGQIQTQAPPLNAAVITDPRTYGAQFRVNF